MRFKYIVILVGGLILSTNLEAAVSKNNLTPAEKLKLLGEAHKHNTVYDNYHTGGIPFEPLEKHKGKVR